MVFLRLHSWVLLLVSRFAIKAFAWWSQPMTKAGITLATWEVVWKVIMNCGCWICRRISFWCYRIWKIWACAPWAWHKTSSVLWKAGFRRERQECRNGIWKSKKTELRQLRWARMQRYAKIWKKILKKWIQFFQFVICIHLHSFAS